MHDEGSDGKLQTMYDRIKQVREKIRLQARKQTKHKETMIEDMGENEKLIAELRKENRKLRAESRGSYNSMADELALMLDDRPKAEKIAFQKRPFSDVLPFYERQIQNRIADLNLLKHDAVMRFRKLQQFCETYERNDYEQQDEEGSKLNDNLEKVCRGLANSFAKMKLKTTTAKAINNLYVKIKTRLENDIGNYPEKIKKAEGKVDDIRKENETLEDLRQKIVKDCHDTLKERAKLENEVRWARKDRDFTLTDLRFVVKQVETAKDPEELQRAKMHARETRKLTQHQMVARPQSRESKKNVARLRKRLTKVGCAVPGAHRKGAVVLSFTPPVFETDNDVAKDDSLHRLKRAAYNSSILENYEQQAVVLEELSGLRFFDTEDLAWYFQNQIICHNELVKQISEKETQVADVTFERNEYAKMLHDLKYKYFGKLEESIGKAERQLEKSKESLDEKQLLFNEKNQRLEKMLGQCESFLHLLVRGATWLGCIDMGRFKIPESDDKLDTFNRWMVAVPQVAAEAESRLQQHDLTREEVLAEANKDECGSIEMHSNNQRITSIISAPPDTAGDIYRASPLDDNKYLSRAEIKRQWNMYNKRFRKGPA